MIQMNEIEIKLPYPPTVNNYKKVGRTIVTKSGKLLQQRVNSDATKRFYYEVWMKVRQIDAFKTNKFPIPFHVLLEVAIDIYPPDKRRRDSDNCIKIIFDSLQRAGVMEDDYQIARHVVQRCSIIPGGEVIVRINPL